MDLQEFITGFNPIGTFYCSVYTWIDALHVGYGFDKLRFDKDGLIGCVLDLENDFPGIAQYELIGARYSKIHAQTRFEHMLDIDVTPSFQELYKNPPPVLVQKYPELFAKFTDMEVVGNV